VHVCFATGGGPACIAQGNHGGFTNVLSSFPGGINQMETFDSVFTGDLTLNAVPLGSLILTGPVQVLIQNRSNDNQTGTFQTEMLAMNLVGGGMMVRESPTLPSLGQTSITPGFTVDSFFDVFTELSLDGGSTWIPQTTGPTRVTLMPDVPEPSTAGLLAIGGLAVLVLRRRRLA
jgi:hypothetical protein